MMNRTDAYRVVKSDHKRLRVEVLPTSVVLLAEPHLDEHVTIYLTLL